MRFVAESAGYRLVAIGTDYEVLASGRGRINAPGYTVEFKQGELTDYERKVARERLSFRGVPTEVDGTPIDPTLTRASAFDTEWVPERIRPQVESALLSNPDFNRAYILVEKVKAAKPWPKYDETRGGGRGVSTAQVIAERVSELGLNAEEVIQYERENKNRADVIEALEALGAPAEEETLVVA